MEIPGGSVEISAREEHMEVASSSRTQRIRRASGRFPAPAPAPASALNSASPPTTESAVPAKRRCNLKPQKNLSTIADLENYYRNEKYKAPTLKSLETIFEEPVQKKGELVFLGAVKPRRFIFNGKVTKEKLKKRKTKVKGLKRVPKKKRITMDAFLKRMHSMSATDPSSEILANLLTSCQLTTMP